ncbi:MAG: 6-carboxytetrahydropterin synthase, partial [Alphaproteobacteria bacterium]|nr:6-carboxytetrahydropterin synthase [Alphaproteobacteria bacterium]
MDIFRAFTFEAAHMLPEVPEGHKCRRLHGHSFRAEIHVTGPVDEKGWVMDFAEITQAWQPLHDVLDHHYLNEV